MIKVCTCLPHQLQSTQCLVFHRDFANMMMQPLNLCDFFPSLVSTRLYYFSACYFTRNTMMSENCSNFRNFRTYKRELWYHNWQLCRTTNCRPDCFGKVGICQKKKKLILAQGAQPITSYIQGVKTTSLAQSLDLHDFMARPKAQLHNNFIKLKVRKE